MLLIYCYKLYFKYIFYRNEVHSKSSISIENDDNDKDGCEMEYLRNILYEYMMGKQPMVSNSIIIM